MTPTKPRKRKATCRCGHAIRRHIQDSVCMWARTFDVRGEPETFCECQRYRPRKRWGSVDPRCLAAREMAVKEAESND